MKIYVLILVLIFNFQTLSKADDIGDLELEGMSIGDSLLDFFSKEEINKSLATYYKDDKHSTSRTTSINYKNYDQIDISFITKDKNYKIIGISAAVYSENIPEGCKMKSNQMKSFVEKTLDKENYIYEESSLVHPVDTSGKSTVDSKYYYFVNGDVVAIQCYNFSKETNFTSALKLNLAKSIHVNWLEDEAYN